jgi:hypothetical protein
VSFGITPETGESTGSLPFIVRTFVPIIVGFLLSVAVKYGFHLTSASLTVYVTFAITAVYTALAHYVETKWPWLGKYLVSAGLTSKKPVYLNVAQPAPAITTMKIGGGNTSTGWEARTVPLQDPPGYRMNGPDR